MCISLRRTDRRYLFTLRPLTTCFSYTLLLRLFHWRFALWTGRFDSFISSHALPFVVSLAPQGGPRGFFLNIVLLTITSCVLAFNGCPHGLSIWMLRKDTQIPEMGAGILQTNESYACGGDSLHSFAFSPLKSIGEEYFPHGTTRWKRLFEEDESVS